MNHEVYICYDEQDQITADAICHVLEDNKIKCWFKTRDLGVKDMVDGIMAAIKQSKVMILVFSNNSKDSNFVNSEVDMAFTDNIPILVFKIDESSLDGSLEFFLSNKHWLDAYPNPEVEFENLIKDTSNILGKPIRRPVVSNQVKRNRTRSSKSRQTTRSKPKSERKPREPGSNDDFFSKYKFPIIIGVILLLLIAVVGVVGIMSLGGGGGLFGKDYTISIDGLDVDDDRDTEYSWNYSYFVFGTISPEPDSGMTVRTTFYDSSGSVIDKDEKLVSEIEGDILGMGVSDSDDIVKVSVELCDSEGKVVAQVEGNNFQDIM